MKKSLRDFLPEKYQPQDKAKDEKRFIAKHTVKITKDVNGNGDDVFKASNIKVYNRHDEHGYNPGEDETKYEGYEVEDLEMVLETMTLSEYAQLDELSRKTLASYVKRSANELDHHAQQIGRNTRDMDPNLRKDPEFRQNAANALIHSTKERSKRYKGIMRASTKLAKEETENLTEAKDGYHVVGGRNFEHHGVHRDSKSAIRKCSKLEDDTGHVHLVHHVKDGKIAKSWSFSDSEQRYAPHDDWKGEEAHHILPHHKEEVENLDEAVEVRHNRYLRSHGKKARGGYGAWSFTHKEFGDASGDDVHHAQGSFSEASKSAKKWAKGRGHRAVYVMEGVENLDELSKKTLASYINKAHQDTTDNFNDRKHHLKDFVKKLPDGSMERGAIQRGFDAKDSRMARDIGNRRKGIARATARLAKEETQLPEGKTTHAEKSDSGRDRGDKKWANRKFRRMNKIHMESEDANGSS